MLPSALPDDNMFPWGWVSAIFKDVMTEMHTVILCVPPQLGAVSMEQFFSASLWGFLRSPPTEACLRPATLHSVRTNRNSTGWVQMGHQLDWPWQSPPPAPAQPPRCLITCTHKPHLSSHWFSCRSTCLPVALSLSNKDFIVCIVVYGCPRETEYYVY